MFSKRLINWYLNQKRDLPWRNTNQPYPVWISEIILQQTRVNQGLPYYIRFIEAFPDIETLANANEQEVLKLWQGLGYYSRARNLHQAAKWIVNINNGVFPSDYIGLLQLKGVGKYTAAAIASFCYNQAVPVIDGNVYRVLSRYFGIETDIASTEAYNVFFKLSESLIDKKKPDLYNQAIMEFGALHCVPVNPDCENCIFNDSCVALQKRKVQQLPFKSKKVKVQKRFLNYLIPIDNNGNTIIRKRTSVGYWKHLFEFPLIESPEKSSNPDFNDLLMQTNKNIRFEYEPVLMNSEPIRHKLTHRDLHINFWRSHVLGNLENGVDFETIKTFPLPIVLFNFVEKNF